MLLRRIVLLLTVMAVSALLVTLAAGTAVAITAAATFQCAGIPCYGSNNNDQITERQGNGVPDEIRALRGDDRVNASLFTNDRDELFGGPQDDLLRANDNDRLDVVNGGSGFDRCIVDRGDVVRSCERVSRR